MFHNNSSKNKFGYFKVGDHYTYSRFEASVLSKYTGKPVKWYLNDEYYNSFNWKVEPKEDIKTLYKQRAQALREKYDYLVLMYSGGIDSCNILHSFIDNGIKLDEICTIGAIDGSKNDNAFGIGEIVHEAIPYIKKLENSNLLNGTKFRLVDNSQQQYDTVKNLTVDTREETYYNYNLMNNMTSLSKYDVRSYVEDYRKIVDSDKKMCLIWGEGKPSIQYDMVSKKHKFVIFLNGTYDFACSPKTQRQNHPGYYDEMFYWDDANIMIKQGHLCLKYLKNTQLFKDLFVETDALGKFKLVIKQSENVSYEVENPLRSAVYTTKDNKLVFLKLPFVHSLIYPGVESPKYNQGKQKSKIYNPVDEWLRINLTEQSKKWYDGYNYHAKLGGLLGKVTPGTTTFCKEFYLE